MGKNVDIKLDPPIGNLALHFALAAGTLPQGLTMSTAGLITGKAEAAGTWNLSVRVGNLTPLRASVVFPVALTVTPAPVKITSSALAQGKSGQSYQAALEAKGGTPAYTWSVTAGSLPGGLSLAADTGVIAGTPTGPGTSAFTVTVADHGAPMQEQTKNLELKIAPAALVITSSALSGGQVQSPYSTTLQVTGGVPGYTWSMSSGKLPAGLSLNAAGVISGMPTSTGNSTFAVTVTDSTKKVKTASLTLAIAPAPPAPQTTAPLPSPSAHTTWFIRPDGGTRYSANVPEGQCDGKADVRYSGVGVNQHCAFNDFRFLWDDNSGTTHGLGTWIIAGGDTVLIRGCTASASQVNASNPDCRLGWDTPSPTATNNWCYYVGSYTCWNPPIPAGTAAAHTRILGQNYANCNAGNQTNPKNYASNLTQLFAGFSTQNAFNLQDTQYVDVQCIELTTHNGVCTTAGSPSFPRPCNTNYPLDDFAGSGFLTNNATSNVAFQDVYVHGFNASGFNGPIGGAITMTRVFVGFNGFSGWNFDDGNDTPDAAGSAINASYVTMMGNGCYEEYPVKDSFPARACYDDNSGGFGDAWSGQDTNMDSFTCDHCLTAYNTKDAFIGPHVNLSKLTVTNSESYGNMGAQWKWNSAPNANVLFQNNLTIGNCARFGELIPGAAHSFASSSGLPGAYLSDYCRAAGNTVAISAQQNSSILFANNTFVNDDSTAFLVGCGPITNQSNGTCATSTFKFANNIFLGYYTQGNEAPGLFYLSDPTVTISQTNNIQFGNRSGDGQECGTNGNLCVDPDLVGEPAQQPWTTQTFLDNFNFHPSATSPAEKAGVTYSGMLTTDFFGSLRGDPPTIGAVEP